MDLENLSVAQDTELLSLKDRILLMQNRERKTKEVTPVKTVLKRVHSISDSDDSDSELKQHDEDFELPELDFLPSVSKVKEIVILSDSEDEAHIIDIHSKVIKNHDYLSTYPNSKQALILSDSEDEILIESIQPTSNKNVYSCLTDEPEKLLNDLASVEDKPKTSKKSKKSPAKSTKTIEKEIEKQKRLELREEKKREKELAKALKQSEKELQKINKPDECMKAMRVIIDHNLILENGSQDIFCSLDEGNMKYSIEENPISCSVAWCKTIVNVTVENNQVLKEQHEEFENELVVFIPNSEFIKLVHSALQKSKGKDSQDAILSDYIANINSMFPQMKITCVIVNFEKYISNLKGTEARDPALKRIAKQVSKIAIEEAIVEVQVQVAVNFTFLNTMRELGDLIFRFTKAIAEAPQKREKQLQKDLAFSWYADADTSCPVKLGKEKSSYIKLWQQQLQQFQNVGPETAEAIAAMYSSPEHLLKAYRQCATKKEAELLLQDIVVRRNYGPLGTQRRVGPELSYKIFIFFTAQDGQQIIQR